MATLLVKVSRVGCLMQEPKGFGAWSVEASSDTNGRVIPRVPILSVKAWLQALQSFPPKEFSRILRFLVYTTAYPI